MPSVVRLLSNQGAGVYLVPSKLLRLQSQHARLRPYDFTWARISSPILCSVMLVSFGCVCHVVVRLRGLRGSKPPVEGVAHCFVAVHTLCVITFLWRYILCVSPQQRPEYP